MRLRVVFFVLFLSFGWILSTTSTVGAGEPIDPEQLATMRRSLESYLLRIQTIRMQFVRTWEENPNSQLLQSVREHQKQKLQERLKTADAEDRERIKRSAMRLEAERVNECELLDAFPSLRLEVRTLWSFPDGTKEEEHILKIAHDNSYKEIKFNYNRAYTSDNVQMFKFSSNMPTIALGRHVEGALGQPLSTLLTRPEVTTIEGRESVHGIEAVVLKIGPTVAPGHSIQGLPGKSWVKLWLAPSRNYLAIKMEYHYINSSETTGPSDNEKTENDRNVHTYELADFQPVSDQARGETVMFPHQLTYTDTVGTTHWQINQVEINPSVSSKDFEKDTPSDFLVSHNGAVPKVRLSGGEAAQQKAVSETTQAARELLAQTPASASGSQGSFLLRFVLPFGLLLTVVSLVLIRRFRHAS